MKNRLIVMISTAIVAGFIGMHSGLAQSQICTPVNGVCAVTEATGEGSHSLKACIDTASCSKIIFAVPEVTIAKTISFSRSNIVIDGENKTKLVGNLPMLLEISKSNITLQRLAFANSSGIAVRLLGNGNTISGCSFSGGDIGVGVYQESSNLITQNAFTGIVKSAIALYNDGNLNLAAPKLADAQLVGPDKWTLSGSVASNVIRVELYEADPLSYQIGHGADVPQGAKYLFTINNDPAVGIRSDGTFDLQMDISRYHPAKGYVAISIDGNNNTSPFSKVFIPTSDSIDFFGPDYIACGQAAWFMDTSMNIWGGDYDGDGLANGIEDRNKSCVVDPTETDPTLTDTDGDGVLDGGDNCPAVANPFQEDSDLDGRGDACEGDLDGDLIHDDQDNCPAVSNVDQSDLDADGVGDYCDSDSDGDGYGDTRDNCSAFPNPTQRDSDRDGFGDACDSDGDGDGVIDTEDNCPLIANLLQSDSDADGIGDICDDDIDGDGVINTRDNCPLASNADQLDSDNDGVGDACENDIDGDGIVDGDDNCPAVPNQNQNDLDIDGIGDACDMDVDGDQTINQIDNCPVLDNSDQLDTDLDGLGNICDLDDDGDGFNDDVDNCPGIANASQQDSDNDGWGDACELDYDSDGVPNSSDNCPLVANRDQADTDRDGIGNACESTGSGTGNGSDTPTPDIVTPTPDDSLIGYDIGGSGGGCTIIERTTSQQNAGTVVVFILSCVGILVARRTFNKIGAC